MAVNEKLIPVVSVLIIVSALLRLHRNDEKKRIRTTGEQSEAAITTKYTVLFIEKWWISSVCLYFFFIF